MTSRLYSSRINSNQPHLQGCVGAPSVVPALEGTSLGEQGARHCLASRAAVTVGLRRLKQRRCTLAVMEVGSLRSGCRHGWSLVSLLFLLAGSLYLSVLTWPFLDYSV